MEGQSVSIPVSSHGLHKHSINCPTLATHSFFDLFPVYNKEFRKGEKINLDSISLFGRTNPFVAPAMVTGRYRVIKCFVPYRTIFRGYYDYKEKVKHTFTGETSTSYLSTCRYVTMAELSAAFIQTSGSPAVGIFANTTTGVPDFVYFDAGTSSTSDYKMTAVGRNVYRVLRSMGIAPTWNSGDTRQVDVMPLLCFIRASLDWVFPSQYTNYSNYQAIDIMLKADTVSSLHVNAYDLLMAIYQAATEYFDQSIFDYAQDNPVAGYQSFNDIVLKDITYPTNSVEVRQVAADGTPITNTLYQARSYLTQYIMDSLQSVNNYVKRHQLAGGRLIDNFMAARGEKLSAAVADRSLYLGDDYVNMRVGDVENNAGGTGTQDALGELAGKGIISSSQDNISISCNEEFSEDGQFIVMLSAIPDCPQILYNDPNNFHIAPLDKFDPAFDKLGVEAIPLHSVFTSNKGDHNSAGIGATFGFLNRYYGNVMNYGRLLGDFTLEGRGMYTLAPYHSFRMFDELSNQANMGHSYSYIEAHGWNTQFDRLFYSSNADNLITLLNFSGSCYLEKLPLGDSYDWDDDEFNKKVQVLLNGSKV